MLVAMAVVILLLRAFRGQLPLLAAHMARTTHAIRLLTELPVPCPCMSMQTQACESTGIQRQYLRDFASKSPHPATSNVL